jgi:hypothetical protein
LESRIHQVSIPGQYRTSNHAIAPVEHIDAIVPGDKVGNIGIFVELVDQNGAKIKAFDRIQCIYNTLSLSAQFL